MRKPKTQNRTFHLLSKADILTCYEQAQVLAVLASRDAAKVVIWSVVPSDERSEESRDPYRCKPSQVCCCRAATL